MAEEGEGFAMFKSAFAQECLEETKASNTSTDSISAAMLPRERHKLYKSQVKPGTEHSFFYSNES